MKTIILLILSSLISFGAETGLASFYSTRTSSSKTASGERFYDNRLTAAHPKLKFGTFVKVTNLSNKKTVIVKINDRGPFATNKSGRAVYPLRPHPTRIIDLSLAAAKALDFHKKGIIKVKVEVVKVCTKNAPKAKIVK
jgi:rare lipoprotein A